MEITNNEKIVKRLDAHLRLTTRQMIHYDTEEETLKFLVHSIRSKLSCDFVGIILIDGDRFIPKLWEHALTTGIESFSLSVDQCNPNLLTKSMMFTSKDKDSTCEFTNLWIEQELPAWFTVPLKDEFHSLGFFIAGYLQPVTFFPELEQSFDEFGKDVAAAINLFKSKELQQTRIQGVEWINQNSSLDLSVEAAVAKLAKGASKLVGADAACIYLYDENKNCFIYQPPSYGNMDREHKIKVEKNDELSHYFPNVETPGAKQLTIPLLFNQKTVGVLFIENKNNGIFTQDDLETLDFLSNHVAVMLENARLYRNEKENKQRLHYLLDYQQSLVKKTVEGDSFDGITDTLSKLFSTSVILLDRFLRPLSYKLFEKEEEELQELIELATYKIVQSQQPVGLWFTPKENHAIHLGAWPIDGGGDLLGYLVVDMTNDELDTYNRLSINIARNIYSVQFIKQKLVLDAREQVKESFMNKLLVEKIDDEESIIQYANLFKWDLFRPHRVAVLSLSIQDKNKKINVLEMEAQKSLIWEQIKEKISHRHPEIRMANKDGESILVVPTESEEGKPKVYWSKLYQYVKSWMDINFKHFQVYITVGGKTEKLSDYYVGYIQALKALNVVMNRFYDIGFALFDELGSYTILHELKDSKISDLFIQKHLAPLLEYSEGKSMDLFQTLRVYLERNGSIKETAEELYIHRSSLIYRLEKIVDLLDIDINDSEYRFDLMMAYKLYDLHIGKVDLS
ncbi:helix-turn-helix domain-containing protein [Bacillus tuaregi]|uniref:helix-turn-helix domain-containing protein n=1 Tax=Bacillus tuaregi TaxID=1816695 RepID=UPI0008F9270E|nr:helix-turn-helix domain-containing protein [Bacillus tuaregi]